MSDQDKKKRYKKIIKKDKETGEIIDEQIVEINDEGENLDSSNISHRPEGEIESKSSNNKALPIIIGLVVLALIAIFVLMLRGRNNEPIETEIQTETTENTESEITEETEASEETEVDTETESITEETETNSEEDNAPAIGEFQVDPEHTNAELRQEVLMGLQDTYEGRYEVTYDVFEGIPNYHFNPIGESQDLVEALLSEPTNPEIRDRWNSLVDELVAVSQDAQEALGEDDLDVTYRNPFYAEEFLFLYIVNGEVYYNVIDDLDGAIQEENTAETEAESETE